MVDSLLRSATNYVRFMPGRVSENGKTLFEGARYFHEALASEEQKAPMVGVPIGPTQGVLKNDAIVMSPGGIILPIQPNDDFKTVDVDSWRVKDRRDPTGKTKIKKSVVKLASLAQLGDHVVVKPYSGENVVYFEIWTGDFAAKPAEGTYQLIQANMFSCGSVAFVGNNDNMAIVTTKSKSRAKQKAVEDSPEKLRDMEIRGGAKLVSERQGDIVGGVPLWVARTFAVHFSATDSEAVLVRQLNDFWLCTVENGLPTIEPVPADKYEKRFERLFMEQPIKAVSEKTAAAA